MADQLFYGKLSGVTQLVQVVTPTLELLVILIPLLKQLLM
jgi:hypothetical protein